MHTCYNRKNFPIFVGNHGNWDICMNDKGYFASIPTDEAAKDGCQASSFGDKHHVKWIMGEDWLEQQLTGKLSRLPALGCLFEFRDSSDPQAAPFEVQAWLRRRSITEAQATPPSEQPLEFCSRNDGTHVLGLRYVRSYSQPPEHCTASLEELRVTGRRPNLRGAAYDQAERLAAQQALLGTVVVHNYG